MTNKKIIIYGYHAVYTALLLKKRVIKCLFATNKVIEKLSEVISNIDCKVKIVTNEQITQRLGSLAVHQGVFIEAYEYKRLSIDDLEPEGIVLALDKITDTYNIGSIIRTAAAFGVEYLIVTKRYIPDISSAIAKVACGGLEYVKIVEVNNLALALTKLAKIGFYIIGLEASGNIDIERIDYNPPIVMVLGSEASGLRQLTKKNCDALVKIKMKNAVNSLNVSHACAIALNVLSKL